MLIYSPSEIIELYNSEKHLVPVRINLGAEQASSISAAQDATDLFLQTASNGPVQEVPFTDVPSASARGITGTINPSTITSTAVTFSTATASGSGYNAGDIIATFLDAGQCFFLDYQWPATCTERSRCPSVGTEPGATKLSCYCFCRQQ